MRSSLVLCYHAVSEAWPAPLAVRSADLERQLGGSLRAGFEAVTFSEAVRSGDRKVMAVTFDDAYQSVYELARPILSELEIPATVFVPTGYPGDGEPMAWPGIDRWLGTPWEPELRRSSWDQLRELAAAGWEIGSHTKSHPRLTRLTDDELAGELAESRERCSTEIGTVCEALAYPYGDVDERVVSAASAAGYTSAATLAEPLGAGSDRPLRWPRLGIYRGDGPVRMRLKSSLYLGSRHAWNASQSTLKLVRRLSPGR